MSLRPIAIVLLPLMFWVIALVGLLGWVRRDRGEVTGRGDVAAVTTVAYHLGAATWLRLTRRRPRPGLDPEWADVRAERHRRQGAVLAASGVLAALAWLPVRPGAGPGAVGGPVVLVVAGNLGFQPVVLGALMMVVASRVRLGRALAEGSEAGA